LRAQVAVVVVGKSNRPGLGICSTGKSGEGVILKGARAPVSRIGVVAFLIYADKVVERVVLVSAFEDKVARSVWLPDFHQPPERISFGLALLSGLVSDNGLVTSGEARDHGAAIGTRNLRGPAERIEGEGIAGALAVVAQVRLRRESGTPIGIRDEFLAAKL